MREVISTEDAPKAIGPYSQAIRTDHLIFCSGQIGLDPGTGAIVEGGVMAQTNRALQNLDGVLTAAGSALSKVIKTTVFLSDMADFESVNAAYEKFFSQDPPARSTFAVQGLPKGAAVEIEAIAQL